MPAIEFEVPDLYESLESLLAQIPRGRVTTYGDLAEALGDLAAARWVGEYLVDHPHTSSCNCHRVVRRTGEAGLYLTGDTRLKQQRLQQEGIVLCDGRIELARFRFTSFRSTQPLCRLVEWQNRISDHVRLSPFAGFPPVVAAVDVAYTGDAEAVGAYVLVESSTGRLLWSTTVQMRVAFPYIPGFLAFREIPVYLQLLKQAKQAQPAELVLVDGNGRLHHRFAGVATCLGVLADRATIGVGKKLLCGRVDLKSLGANEFRPVVHQGKDVGVAVKGRERFRPVFVSPGQHVDLESCRRIVGRLFCGHRLPEPIYWADRICRQAAGNGPPPDAGRPLNRPIAQTTP